MVFEEPKVELEKVELTDVVTASNDGQHTTVCFGDALPGDFSNCTGGSMGD